MAKAEHAVSNQGSKQTLSTSVTGLSVDVLALPDARPVADTLSEIGYAELRIDLTVDAEYNAKARTLQIGPVRIDAAKAAKLEFSTALADVPDLEKLAGGRTPALDTVRLSQARLTLTDQSLTNRLLDALAKQTRSTREKVAADVAANAGQAIAMFAGNSPFAAELASAVRGFVTKPGSIDLRIEPSKPVALDGIAMAAVGNPARALSALNATVTAR